MLVEPHKSAPEPPAPSTTALDRAALEQEVAALRESALGAAADAEGRADMALRLDSLRLLWKRAPDLFRAEDIEALRAIAQQLVPGQAKAPAPHEVLQGLFGYPSFRPGQQEIIEAVLAGRDCIAVMPTGAGKSLTYQLPARILPGVALVVSPLIALMKDQVDAMTGLGMRATFLNSSLLLEERRARMQAVAQGAFELVYVAPEGLEAQTGAALLRVPLSLIAVDEAHCISQWGHDFRPAYRNLSGLRARFGSPRGGRRLPVLALTATATHEVTRDIAAQLGMDGPAEFRGSFFRKNLQLHVYKKGGPGVPTAREAILRLVAARREQSGIIYCLSRKSVEELANFLGDHGLPALAYHAGMTAEARTRVQDAFASDRTRIIVATIAFGMGIDKAAIRYVIHRDMPRSIEAYYQEIGRAGRDGAPSDCVLFYSWVDVLNYERFADESPPEIAEWHRRKARELYELAERRACRHQKLVRYFGQRIAPCETACDVCTGGDLLRKEGKRRRRGEM